MLGRFRTFRVRTDRQERFDREELLAVLRQTGARRVLVQPRMVGSTAALVEELEPALGRQVAVEGRGGVLPGDVWVGDE